MSVKAKVHVTLKRSVLDPKGRAVGRALRSLGFDTVQDVREGRYLEVVLAEDDPKKAWDIVDQACKALLANAVVEKYDIAIEP